MFNPNAPQINSPGIVGFYPNSPVLFACPISGHRPMTFFASDIPEGLMLDEESGVFTGMVSQPGRYNIHITASNEFGSCKGEIVFVIGDTLALTPPMGWNSWNLFGENVNERLVRDIADAMVTSGMRDVGYHYINLDDFWQGNERDKNGQMQSHTDRFPSGIKSLADHVHDRGLKLGIYSDAAEKTCAEQMGSLGYEEIDAQTWASWGIDLVKYDYCFAPEDRDTAVTRYTKMAKAIRNTGRSIIFSICEWGPRKPWLWARQSGGHYWRTTWDIRDCWDTGGLYNNTQNGIIQILDRQVGLEAFAGPGHWNDPDMLVIGISGKGKYSSHNGEPGMRFEEYRSHMSLWCLLSAPLLCGLDIRNMTLEAVSLLTNPEVLAVNQDALGRQASRLVKLDHIEIWAKPMADGSIAAGIFNRGNSAASIKLKLAEIFALGKHNVRDLWQKTNIGISEEHIELTVGSHDTKMLLLSPEHTTYKAVMT